MRESILDGKIDHESILHPFDTPVLVVDVSMKRGARAILLAIWENRQESIFVCNMLVHPKWSTVKSTRMYSYMILWCSTYTCNKTTSHVFISFIIVIHKMHLSPITFPSHQPLLVSAYIEWYNIYSFMETFALYTFSYSVIATGA